MRAMDRSCSGQPSHLHPPDHLRQGTLDLQSVRFLVLDEADEILDRSLPATLEPSWAGRLTALLSATMPEWLAGNAGQREHGRAKGKGRGKERRARMP